MWFPRAQSLELTLFFLTPRTSTYNIVELFEKPAKSTIDEPPTSTEVETKHAITIAVITIVATITTVFLSLAVICGVMYYRKSKLRSSYINTSYFYLPAFCFLYTDVLWWIIIISKICEHVVYGVHIKHVRLEPSDWTLARFSCMHINLFNFIFFEPHIFDFFSGGNIK